MLSYKTTQRERDDANAKAADIMAKHAAKPYSHVQPGPAVDKAAEGARLLDARKRG